MFAEHFHTEQMSGCSCGFLCVVLLLLQRFCSASGEFENHHRNPLDQLVCAVGQMRIERVIHDQGTMGIANQREFADADESHAKRLTSVPPSSHKCSASQVKLCIDTCANHKCTECVKACVQPCAKNFFGGGCVVADLGKQHRN